MNEEKFFFNNNCFLPAWGVDDVEPEFPDDEDYTEETTLQQTVYQRQNKDLPTLLAELEEIKNNIDNIKAKQWQLAKLMKFHKEGFVAK